MQFFVYGRGYVDNLFSIISVVSGFVNQRLYYAYELTVLKACSFMYGRALVDNLFIIISLVIGSFDQRQNYVE
jgi:hypothetical protein